MRIITANPRVASVKSLPLTREATAWRTIATATRTTAIRKPFQVRAASIMKIPATAPLIRTVFLEGSSASRALTIFTAKYAMKAMRKAARAYSLPLEKTEVLIGRAMNAMIRAATTPIVLSNISLPIR